MKWFNIIFLLFLTNVTIADELNVFLTDSADNKELQIVDSLKEKYNCNIINGSFHEGIQSIKNGKADIALGNITITSEREKIGDFTIPYADSSIKILKKDEVTLQTQIVTFITKSYKVFLVFIGFIFVCGSLFYLAELGQNSGINNNPIKGIGEGMWLTLATSTTVGYGDISPKKIFGRILASVIMFVGIMTFSYVISVANDAWSSNNANIEVKDFNKFNVGTVDNSTSKQWVEDKVNDLKLYDNVDKAYIALNIGEIDFIVYDGIILDKLVTKGFILSDVSYNSQQYGVLTKNGCKYRDLVNSVIK